MSKTGGGPVSARVYFTRAPTCAEEKYFAEGREGTFGGRKGCEDTGPEYISFPLHGGRWAAKRVGWGC